MTWDPVNPLPNALGHLFSEVCATEELTLADRYGLLAILLMGNVGEDDLRCINRILYSVRRGQIKLSDSLSALHAPDLKPELVPLYAPGASPLASHLSPNPAPSPDSLNYPDHGYSPSS